MIQDGRLIAVIDLGMMGVGNPRAICVDRRGWLAESRYYSGSEDIKLNADYVDWGGVSKSKMNPWVTADALSVLVRAGRWSP